MAVAGNHPARARRTSIGAVPGRGETGRRPAGPGRLRAEVSSRPSRPAPRQRRGRSRRRRRHTRCPVVAGVALALATDEHAASRAGRRGASRPRERRRRVTGRADDEDRGGALRVQRRRCGPVACTGHSRQARRPAGEDRSRTSARPSRSAAPAPPPRRVGGTGRPVEAVDGVVHLDRVVDVAVGTAAEELVGEREQRRTRRRAGPAAVPRRAAASSRGGRAGPDALRGQPFGERAGRRPGADRRPGRRGTSGPRSAAPSTVLAEVAVAARRCTRSRTTAAPPRSPWPGPAPARRTPSRGRRRRRAPSGRPARGTARRTRRR